MTQPVVAEATPRWISNRFTPLKNLALHQWFDATKAHLPDIRHRMLLHNGFGMLLAEQVFGPVIEYSPGRRVFVRDLAAQHIIEDLGFVPTVHECLRELPLQPWMAGACRIPLQPMLPSLVLTDSR